MAWHFSFEVLAPQGLAGIDEQLLQNGLPLTAYRSDFNGQVILRRLPEGPIELDMDPSTTETLFGSGYMDADSATAEAYLNTLHQIFQQMALPHRMGLDLSDGTRWLIWRWPAVTGYAEQQRPGWQDQ
ncbi:MAG: hypothetical protein IGS03_05120 [Candidatus Sericytochromatia bacterium]|nr:hypothetical protein [Candidatus Sericytochromatia bacterium]